MSVGPHERSTCQKKGLGQPLKSMLDDILVETKVFDARNKFPGNMMFVHFLIKNVTKRTYMYYWFDDVAEESHQDNHIRSL